jgi:hypothetical protein
MLMQLPLITKTDAKLRKNREVNKKRYSFMQRSFIILNSIVQLFKCLFVL